MADKEKEIVDLKTYKTKKQTEDNKPPEFIIKTFELLLEKAKQGKLTIAAMHYMYEADEEDEEKGSTLLWHRDDNSLELLGISELIKTVALENFMYYPEDEE
jgi:hypothetical protein